MGVEQGLKKTEIGQIPLNWEVKKIAEVAPLQRGFDLPSRSLVEGPYPVVYSNGIVNYHSNAMVRGPGVVTGRSGTIGKMHFVESDYWPHNTSLWVTRFNGNSPRYIYYLYSKIGFNRFSSGSGVPTLNRNDAHSFQITIPSTRVEQEAIANALSDADAYIESLEKLIEKKRLIKKGVMQELLSGQRRLPGFSKKWLEVEAGSIGVFRGGNGFPHKTQGMSSGEFPYFKVSDMNNEGNSTFMKVANNFVSESVRKSIGANVFSPDTIVFAKVGAAIFLERKKLLRVKSCLDNNMAGFTITNPEVSSRFIHLLFLNFQLSSLVSASALPSLSSSILKSIKLFLPSEKREQEAIEEIITDIESEIEISEKLLSKALLIKQGMMQELLTGRIRLV